MTVIGAVPNRPAPGADRSVAAILGNWDFITNWLNGQNIDDTNLKPGGVGTASLANGSVTAIKLASGALVGWTDLPTRSVLDVGVANNTRAGRVLASSDFTALLGLASAPVGLWNCSDLTDSSGNARALTNKGAITFGKGITGAAVEAAIGNGSATSCLYLASAAWQQVPTITFGGWHRTGKRGVEQAFMSKYTAASKGYLIEATAANLPRVVVSVDGAANISAVGVTDICDDRQHFVIGTYDGVTLKLYVDGALEASVTAGIGSTGPIFASVAPLNLGGYGGDAGTAPTAPTYGRFDEMVLTADVLNQNQIRLLMAQKYAHGAGTTPKQARVSIKRRNRGGPLVAGDFSVTPKVLYNFTNGSLADGGSLGVALAATGAPTNIAGADGQAGGGYRLSGVGQYFSAADTGLPTGTSSRTIGGWINTTYNSNQVIVAYGTTGASEACLYVDGTGLLTFTDGVNVTAGTLSISDGNWHFCVVVIDNTAADAKVKVYCDTRLIATGVSLTATVLSGAGKLKVGARGDASWPLLGNVTKAFITDYAMTPDEQMSVFSKASLPLGASTADDDRGLLQMIQAVDATNVYVLTDMVKELSGKVNADGSIAQASEDFRVTNTASGFYTVFFPPGYFSTPPALTLTTLNADSRLPGRLTSVTTAAAFIEFVNSSDGSHANEIFEFIVRGRGPLSSQHQIDIGVQ